MTKNKVNGNQDECKITRLHTETIIVWIKRVIPKEIGCLMFIIIEELIREKKIKVLIISVNSLNKILVLETKVVGSILLMF